MAKPLTFENGQKYWGLTKAEDYVVIDAIERIERYVPKTDMRWSGIQNFFLDGGKPLWDLDLITINDHLKRKGWPPIVLREGHSDSHSILRGPEKAQIRDAIRRQLRSLDECERADVIAKMYQEIAKQPERNVVLDARKELRTDREPPASKIADTLKRAVALGVLRTASEPEPMHDPEISVAVASRPAGMTKEAVLELAREAAQTPEARRKQIEAFERIEHQKGVKNSQFGRTWITKDGESKRVTKDELGTWFQLGWKAGRTMKTTNTPTQEANNTMSQPIEVPERIGVDDVERALKERRDRAAQPSRAEYDALKAEVGVLRTDMSRLMRLVVEFAQR